MSKNTAYETNAFHPEKVSAMQFTGGAKSADEIHEWLTTLFSTVETDHSFSSIGGTTRRDDIKREKVRYKVWRANASRYVSVEPGDWVVVPGEGLITFCDSTEFATHYRRPQVQLGFAVSRLEQLYDWGRSTRDSGNRCWTSADHELMDALQDIIRNNS